MSLRGRLLVATLVLVAVGLVTADFATFAALRSFLTDRVDQQLDAIVFPTARSLERINETLATDPNATLGEHNVGPGPGANGGPLGIYAELRDPEGNLLTAVAFDFAENGVRRPKLPTILPAIGAAEPLPRRFNVGVEGSSTRYRVLVAPTGRQDGTFVVIAAPLDDVEGTLGRLFRIEATVTLAALGSLAVLAWWLVRLGLRPLAEMEATAEHIAGGDLSRRVARDDDRTEVGRLGRSLNAMLVQIEAAFAERSASEDRLRRFVADASHELRTPLTSIRGYAELFRRGAADRPEDLAKVMRRIEEEADRMGILVDDLLLLARLDQGRPLEMAPVDLVRVASDAVDDAHAVEPDRPITLIVLASPGTPVVVAGDDARLRQVAANLLANIRTHTPALAPVEVRVTSDPGTQSACIEVVDHGQGLTPEESLRVFERFYRADPSRARASGGAGLGLSIVAAIAHAHGGTASMGATPGGGATFSVVLPIHGHLPEVDEAIPGVRAPDAKLARDPAAG